MGTRTGNITLTCPGKEDLKFREGEPTQVVLDIAQAWFGPGCFEDSDGFVVSPNTSLAAGAYAYRRSGGVRRLSPEDMTEEAQELKQLVSSMSASTFGKTGYKLMPASSIPIEMGMPVQEQGPLAETMHSAFGSFQDLTHSAEPDASTFRAYQALCQDMCSSYTSTDGSAFSSLLDRLDLDSERRGGVGQRLQDFRRSLRTYFTEQGLVMKTLDSQTTQLNWVNNGTSGGALAAYDNGTASFYFSILEGMESIGETEGGWTYPQLVFRAAEHISEHLGEPVVEGTCCPMLGLELMGHHLRVVAIYYTTHVCAQPLTTYLHLGPQWHRQPLYVKHVMRVLKACAASLKILQKYYEECLQNPPISPASRDEFHTPYMLRRCSGSPYTDVQQLLDHAQLWRATAPDGSACLLKLVVHLYPMDLHNALAEEGLTPKLRNAIPYPGGLLLLEMEVLERADGWVRLDELGSRCSDWPGLEQALMEAAARFAGPDNAARRVHGDLRAPNVLVRVDAAGHVAGIRILDLDCAGIEGTARYGFGLNADIDWPAADLDGRKILVEHDQTLIRRAVHTCRPVAVLCVHQGRPRRVQCHSRKAQK